MFAAERGHDELIDLFLAHPSTDVKIQAAGGFTAAVMAAVNGRPDLGRKLMAVQKEQEAKEEQDKRTENLDKAKGKSPKKKKATAVAVEPPTASEAQPASANRRTFRIIGQSSVSIDAGTPAERTAAQIRSAIREAKAVAEIVGKDLGWTSGEVVAVEELSPRGDGGAALIQNLEVAVTFAF